MKELSKRIENFKESIFATMTKLAIENKAINLSQGFPDFDGPTWIKDLAKGAVDEGHNQYAPAIGVVELRETLSKVYQSQYQLNYCPQSEITVTNGATQAIFCSIMAIVNPRDEVIVFEPFYDSYLATIELAGGIPVPVTLKHELDFSFDRDELKNAFSDKTKLVLLNTPHNPTGKIFNQEELDYISELVEAHDCYCMSDEVYEYLTFDGIKHVPTAKTKSLKDRTITISSTGKTFGLTGWKVGWACAPKNLTHAIRMIHQYNTFSVCHPMQYAAARALQKLDEYIPEFKREYQSKRDLFIKGLKDLGYDPFLPQGTYFAMTPIPRGENLNDIEYCMKLITEKKVAAIPPSAFYMKSDEGSKFIRFCFAKKDETLNNALKLLV